MPESQKVPVAFEEISKRLKRTELPEVDAVIGIQTGGRIPAVLCAYQLGVPLYMLPIHFRDPENQPEHEAPVVFDEFKLPEDADKVLLVDDVSVTGKTFEKALEVIGSRYDSITTFVLKGKGDFVLFPEIKPCVQWPWL